MHRKINISISRSDEIASKSTNKSSVIKTEDNAGTLSVWFRSYISHFYTIFTAYGCVSTSYIPTLSENEVRGPDVPSNRQAAYENVEPTYTEIPVTHTNVPTYVNV